MSLVDSLDLGLAKTPWGTPDQLRSRKLRPGPGHDPDDVERNQRERLYGAMVAVVAEQGYEAASIGDVVHVAGLSRSAFYRYFDNKLDCFLETFDALAEMATARLVESYRGPTSSSHGRLQSVLEGIVAMVVTQPAAARFWLVETYAAGPRGIDRMEHVAEQFELLATVAIGEAAEHRDMPAPGVRAVLGGLRQMVQTRLRHGREEELPALVPRLLDWSLSYRTSTRLSTPRTPPAMPAPTPEPDEKRRKILTTLTGLVAERGYQDLTTRDVCGRASMSLSTFYNHFADKREAFVAALDEAERQVVEATLPAYERAPDWPRAVRDAIHAFFAFNATHPAMSQLSAQRIFSGGAEGFDRHEDATGRFGAVLRAGYRDYPATNPIAAEAIIGAVAALLYQQIRRHGAKSVYEVAGIASFIALAPFVGAEEACRLANDGWYPLDY